MAWPFKGKRKTADGSVLPVDEKSKPPGLAFFLSAFQS
jgi:hypothetical protein